MLLTMHIKNIALIEEIDIDFHEQVNPSSLVLLESVW